MARPLVPDHRRRICQQNHQGWHRRAKETDKATSEAPSPPSPAPTSDDTPLTPSLPQLWDTAGTERFRSVSRSYYRGAAGAIFVYDVTSHVSFSNLQPFFNDARALASPNFSSLLVGNKLDLADDPPPPSTPLASSAPYGSSYSSSTSGALGLGSQLRATVAPDGREVSALEASRWASTVGIPVTMEVSALSGEGVDEVFGRLARMILTKIELGEVDPDDPMSGIQYGDAGGGWNGGASDGGSIKSSMTGGEDGGGIGMRRRRVKRTGQGGLREWEEVFTLSGRRRNRGCC